MILKTRAIDVPCGVCAAPASSACDLSAGTGWEPTAGRFHRARVEAAARLTKDANAAARGTARPGGS